MSACYSKSNHVDRQLNWIIPVIVGVIGSAAAVFFLLAVRKSENQGEEVQEVPSLHPGGAQYTMDSSDEEYIVSFNSYSTSQSEASDDVVSSSSEVSLHGQGRARAMGSKGGGVEESFV